MDRQAAEPRHSPIEDYALIGDTHTGALVGKSGSIDWLCLPRFDSPACFASLVGTPENGRWLLCPEAEAQAVSRRYRDGTMILETDFETEDGAVTIIDFMPLSGGDEGRMDLIRLVIGRRGAVPMRLEMILRFDYGHNVPWVRRRDYGMSAVAGPDAVQLITPVDLHGESFRTVSHFTVTEGRTVPFTLTWHPSHRPAPAAADPQRMLEDTEAWWRGWSGRCTNQGPHREAVLRSLLTLKALTYSPTGGIVAAPTTSLPEQIGGIRNWDYRFCWLRDSTLTLYALLASGYTEEARAWREWLLRTVAGDPSQLQIMYSVTGERRLQEFELPWLCGYENSRPVRIGNGAFAQLQIDIYGELMDTLHAARRYHIEPSDDAWRVQKVFMKFLEANWDQPDEGIWEMRGPRRQFTHSKVMAWVAMDRAIKTVESMGMEGPVDRWRILRDTIHDDVCRKGFDAARGTFVQYYGGNTLDAALLLIPCVGFLPPEDPRVVGTVEAVQRELMADGLVMRYTLTPEVDGLPPGEGAFLACSFWLADTLAMIGRRDDSEALFERLLALRNDVGLLAEEYDTHLGRQCGNFPQAFSHVGLINTAYNLQPRPTGGPTRQTAEGKPDRASQEPADAPDSHLG